MKICWDNLEELRYNKKTGKWYKNTLTYIYKESCKNCGEPFLGSRKNSKYCCRQCQLNGKGNPMYGKHHSEIAKNKMSKAKKGNKGLVNNWKGGYHSKSIPIYDTYAPQLEWCEEVRRNKEDKNILEVRCFKCGEWYIPTLNGVWNRLQVLRGQTKGECNFYCSDGCKHSCSIFSKSAEMLIRKDAIRAGRLEWLELNKEVQPELRKMVLERDGYQCVKCGNGKPLHCHHIYPVSTDPLESADMDNCLTYCVDCHKEVHQQDGCRYGQLRTLEVC